MVPIEAFLPHLGSAETGREKKQKVGRKDVYRDQQVIFKQLQYINQNT